MLGWPIFPKGLISTQAFRNSIREAADPYLDLGPCRHATEVEMSCRLAEIHRVH